MDVSEFWNARFTTADSYSCVGHTTIAGHRSLDRAARHFGDVQGKRLIDLGSGNGAAALYFASRGAVVQAVDVSDVALTKLARFCQQRGIQNVTTINSRAQEIASLGPVDFVFGSMILHHLEPFDAFVDELRLALPYGKAYFSENSAASSLLVWCRKHIIGKLWVPKYGDPDEFPLTPAEVGALQKRFTTRQEFPEMQLFSMIPPYMLREHCYGPFVALDRLLHHTFLRRYSYHQELYLS